jgi:heme-degrading monooxygenase HmoA
MSDAIAKTPQPPYYAVIFSSLRTEGDNGYGATAARMEELARQQPGFLGIESARSGLGITVGYFRSLEDIAAWKKHVEHAEAQRRGRADWYAAYRVRIAKVERDYGFAKA